MKIGPDETSALGRCCAVTRKKVKGLQDSQEHIQIPSPIIHRKRKHHVTKHKGTRGVVLGLG